MELGGVPPGLPADLSATERIREVVVVPALACSWSHKWYVWFCRRLKAAKPSLMVGLPWTEMPGCQEPGASAASFGVECAALACADARSSRPNVVRELDLRYLAGASKGPVTSESAWIGDPTAGMLRVALRDEGKDGRITTTALVRTDAASG